MGDTSRHLTYFKVENFKRFESFEMNDLGHFNLIVGDNNVGKTSVLEALLFDENLNVWVNNIFTSLSYKKVKSRFVFRDIELLCNQKHYLNSNSRTFSVSTSFKRKNESVAQFHLEFDKILQTVSIKGIPNDSSSYAFSIQIGYNDSDLNVPFISLYSGHDRNLTNFYSRTIQKNTSLKRKVIDLMKVMIPDFENIELAAPFPDEAPYLIVSQHGVNFTLPIAFFGDGSVKLFRILLEIVANQGKRLMIDEVDAGIHFSRFKDFWKVILRAAKEYDVQLFMTTHNQECIKFFKEVLDEEREMQNLSRTISLAENSKTKEVESFTYSFEQFQHGIEIGNEIR
jgi:AAA15 family ATPase/GTPase